MLNVEVTALATPVATAAVAGAATAATAATAAIVKEAVSSHDSSRPPRFPKLLVLEEMYSRRMVVVCFFIVKRVAREAN